MPTRSTSPRILRLFALQTPAALQASCFSTSFTCTGLLLPVRISDCQWLKYWLDGFPAH